MPPSIDLSIPSSPASDTDTIPPSTPSVDTSPSPTLVDNDNDFLVPEPDLEDTEKKKKKKKKSKKKSKAAQGKATAKEEERPQVLCISRNKHWRYISSYHGPWLQLPLELLESLLVLNLDPTTLSAPDPSSFPAPLSPNGNSNNNTLRLPPPTPNRLHPHLQELPPPFPPPKPGKATPPPIDPGVFRSVTQIRRLIDEASELSVRASSGLSSSDLSSLSPTLSHFPNGGGGGGGRSVAMSAMRIHRLRALAVQKLAQAYKLDEIASSVMVMQGGSVFDDLAERVLKVDPGDPDAKYVHFFHEKIPSRQLAESTSTSVLDDLILRYPQRLEYFRTRGIVHCFRDEYASATRDFTHAIKEARAARRHRVMLSDREKERHDAPTRRKRKGGKTNGQAPPDGTAALNDEDDPLQLHPSVLPDAPDPIEPQLYFLRGAAHLQHAIHLIENVLNTFTYPQTTLLSDVRSYRSSLCAIREQVNALIKKSLRDHEKFLSHFDSLDSPGSIPEGDLSFQISYAFLLSESGRPGHSNYPPTSRPPSQSVSPATFTTYHPLLVESHYSILLCYLLLADFRTLLERFKHAAGIVDGLEGYPVFLPPRSMAQAEFVEVLERLAGGWGEGVRPHSLSGAGGGARGKGRLAIEPPPVSPLPISASASSGSADEPCCSSSSSSSTKPLRADAADALDCARILLAPVVKRQAERTSSDGGMGVSGNMNGFMGGGAGGKLKPAPINIPLHGPRVEVILAWLGGVHLPEVEGCV